MKKQTVSDSKKIEMPTTHPDYMVTVVFNYRATVSEDEEVEVHEVWTEDSVLNITGSGWGLDRFLGTIRENARQIALSNPENFK